MGKIKTNFIYNIIYQLLILVIPFITTPYIARTIGADGTGVYSYTYSIVSYFMMFAVLGIGTYGNREIAKFKDNKEKRNKIFSEIYACQLLISTIVLMCYLIYCCFFNKEYLYINIIQAIYVLSTIFDINWFFCGMQEFKLTVTRNGIIKILSFISIFLFVKQKDDLWIYIAILAISTLLNQLSLWPFLKNKVKFVKIKLIDLKRHIKPIIVLFIPTVAMSIYKVMDKIMIGNMVGVTEVGYYEYAEKIINIILTVISALVTVTMPEMTYLNEKGEKDKFYKIFYFSIIMTYFFIIPVIFGFLATSHVLVKLYLGNGFEKTAILLKILSLTLPFSTISSIVRSQILIAKGKDKEYIISILAGALINFLLNTILIKKYGALGAAIATIIAEATVFFMQQHFVKEEFLIRKFLKDIIYFTCSSIIMYVIITIVGKNINNEIFRTVLQILLGVIIYVILNARFIYRNLLENIWRRKK